MSKRRRRARSAGWLIVPWALASPQCYRAELDLRLPADGAASMSGAAGAGGAPRTTLSGPAAGSEGGGPNELAVGGLGHAGSSGDAASGGDAATSGGEGGHATAAAGGAGGEGGESSSCDPTPIYDDPVQYACRGLLPSAAECKTQDPEGWNGCYNGGCRVCSKSVREFPYYFAWHPCCEANTTCGSNDPVKCNSHCPPPTPRDARRPCWLSPDKL